jgi:hypothetical protein
MTRSRKYHKNRNPHQTLRDWRGKRIKASSENRFPPAHANPKARALSAENESAFADFLRASCIQAGIGPTGGLMKSLCPDSYVRQEDNERHLERFAASTTFLRNFENGNGLSLGTPPGPDQKYIDYFVGRLNSLLNDCPPGLAFHMDGTCWRFFKALEKSSLRKDLALWSFNPRMAKDGVHGVGHDILSGREIPFLGACKRSDGST